MTTKRTRFPTLLQAALALALLAGTAPSMPAAAAERQAVPKEGQAPQPRAESHTPSSGSAARSRPSSTSSGSGSGSGAVSRTRPPSGSSGSGSERTRVDRNPDRYRSYYRPHRYRYPYYYYYPHYRSSFYLGYYYPYWYWPWGYWGAVPVYYPPYHRSYYGPGGYGDDLGALDLDVSPEKAEVWVDGERLGVADNFDGFPTYLWLPEGTYDVVFFKEGYSSIHRQYSIYPGVVVDVEDRMTPGESVRPEDLVAPKTTERRDERLRRDAERRSQVEGTPGAPREPFDARGEPGRLRIQVHPADASIYLDGRFLGTASELADLHAGLIVDPGEHRLQVVRPGYDSDEVEFEVGVGEEVSVEVTLEAGSEV